MKASIWGQARPIRSLRLFILFLVANAVSFLSIAVADPDAISREIEQILIEHEIPGASIAIINNNQVFFYEQFGVTDSRTLSPVSEETIFRAGSISKSFTAIAIMMLVEDGYFSLDTPVTSLLPELKINNRWSRFAPVTIAHLLEHTAGFNDIAYRHYLIEGSELSVTDAVRLYAPYESRWKPGTLHSYSNSGPVIAGLIVEEISGETFPEFIQNRLFAPLGMNQSTWVRTEDNKGLISKSYRSDGVTEEPFIEIAGRPSGSLNTTADDLSRLVLLMLGRGEVDGVRYFSAETANRIESPSTSSAAKLGLNLGYGLGNDVQMSQKAIYYGHDGSIDGFAATIRYAPELGAGYVIMINSTSSGLQKVSELIRNFIESGSDLSLPETVTLSEDFIHKVSGQYQTITPRRDFLAPIVGVTQWQGVSFDEGVLKFKGEQWEHVGDAKFQSRSNSAPGLVFEQDANQTRLHTALGSYRRVSSLEMWSKLAVLAALPITLLMALVYALIWIPSAFLGRLKRRGGIAPRLIPSSALVLSMASATAPLLLFGSGDFDILGRPTGLGWTTFVLTIIAPITILPSIIVLYKTQVSRPVFALGAAQTVLSVLVCAYLAHGGWFALQIWNA